MGNAFRFFVKINAPFALRLWGLWRYFKGMHPPILGCMPWEISWDKVDSLFRERNGTRLQYSCLENPRDWGAWWAAVYGVAQSRTRLKGLSSSSSSSRLLIIHTQAAYDWPEIFALFFTTWMQRGRGKSLKLLKLLFPSVLMKFQQLSLTNLLKPCSSSWL